jgi:DNA-binding NarL/FixJ family response regulator
MLKRLAGRTVGLHFTLSPKHTAALRHALKGGAPRFAWVPTLESDQSLLALLTRGLSYAEIGRQLDMSARTVRRRIDQLRTAIGVANSVELAAWAGWYGLYRPPALPSE